MKRIVITTRRNRRKKYNSDVEQSSSELDLSKIYEVIDKEKKEHPLDLLKKQLQDDLEYAWGWHCNIAVCAQDNGVEHAASQKIASQFMKMAFDVDTEPLVARYTNA